MNQIDLQGNRAVVTGGAQGIGYAIAERLLQSGATVCLWDRDADLAALASLWWREDECAVTQVIKAKEA